MNIALCYENVDPTRGGCETYIADLTRRFIGGGHQVHLYAARWNAAALPRYLNSHQVPRFRGPRFLRPWLFGSACLAAMRANHHDVSLGFDKTWGQDVLYPQGGVYSASIAANLRKYPDFAGRTIAAAMKRLDPAVQSFRAIERRQYLGAIRPAIVVNSNMVRVDMQKHLGIPDHAAQVLHAAVDPARLESPDRQAIRRDVRRSWGIEDGVPVGLFVAMNYQLKGLEPLLHSLRLISPDVPFRLVVVGHPNFARYNRLSRRLRVQKRVVFHGFCADSKIAYFASDFLIHPTFYDPCSLVALEARACGLPVITSAFNGAAELLHPPHDGLVVGDPHDRVELASAIRRMLDAEYRHDCSINARQAAAAWTFDDHYRKMMGILESVATRPQAIPSAA